jgi:carbamoyltransferase
MKILGFTAGTHDSSYAIFEDSRLIIHEELERLTRVKETESDVLEYLEGSGVDLNEFDYIVTYPHGNLQFYSPTYLRIKRENPEKCVEIGHHLAHAANAFYTSKYPDALVVTIDGGGWDEGVPGCLTAWDGAGDQVKRLDYRTEPNLGSFWQDCTRQIFGLSGGGPPYGCQAGTVMAMSSMSTKSVKPLPPYSQYANCSDQEKYNLARGIQDQTEDIIKEYMSHFIGDHTNLCLSGGVVLNCVLTGKIKSWFPQIKRIFVPPIPYDAGLAIGCVQFFIKEHLKQELVIDELFDSSYLGRPYSLEDIKAALEDSEDIKYEKCSDLEVAKLLTEKNIISVYGGRSESGRRALGNRSILADPRHEDMKDLINEKVKHRQSFRPFAPSILREKVNEWFEEDIDSPYMSFAIPFKEDKRKLVPAVVHLDGTGRLQTVTESFNKWYYGFIKTFESLTGVPIILNTSFNDREPIVETPKDAIKTFLKTNIDFLYFRELNILVKKNES